MILNQEKMRLRTLILVFCVLFATSACSTMAPYEEENLNDFGFVSVELESDIVVSHETKAAPVLPNVNDFKIEIYKYTESGLLRLYRDTYENTVGQQIRLNAADYKIQARYGDSLAVGFNSIYYSAEQDCPVRPQTNETVSLEAKVANVKVAVEYGENLKYDWPEYYAKVKSVTKGGKKRSLQFDQNETRSGYLPAGTLTVELYLKIDGEWLYYKSPEINALPSDFITFRVDVERAQSDMTITALIDRDLETIEKTYEVSSNWLPQDAPSIKMLDLNGKDFGNKTFEVVEAGDVVRSDLKADINAPGVIDQCRLEVTSEYLSRLGVPAVVDLASDLDPSVEATLKSIGLKWMKGMKGQRLGYVDFSGITKWLNDSVCDSNNMFSATFSLNVVDQRQSVEETQSAPVTFRQLAPKFEFYDIPTYNCWATRIEKITTYLSVGNPDAFKIEYRKYTELDPNAWREMVPGEGSSGNANVYAISGLSPATLYEIRARYNGNMKTQITRYPKTEAAAQIGNNGFEDHTYERFNFSIVWSSTTGTRIWYQPYKYGETDPWWAVNSTATLDNSFTAAYWYYKCFPTVCMTKDNVYAGSRSILVASIAVHDYGSEIKSGDAVTGKLYIGKADNSGEHVNKVISEGHSFSSRPNSMSFYHRFDYHDSPFRVDIRLYNGSTEIASGSYTSGSSDVSSWTEVTVPLTYRYIDRKADKIYISFVSSSTDSTKSRSIKLDVVNTDGSSSTTDNVHAGNIVWLDEVVLNYE